MENFINEEFFDQKSDAMKHIYFAHSLLGGIFYEDYVTPQIRFLARIIGSFLYLTSTSALIMILCRPETSFFTIQNSLTMLFLIQMWVAIVIMVYLKRDTYRALFDHMNDYFSQPAYHHTDETVEGKTVENYNLKIGKCFIVWALITYASMLCQKFSTDKEFYVDYELDFITPFPFTNTQSLIGYILIFHLTFGIFLFYQCIHYGSVVLPVLLSIHLENQTTHLRNEIRRHTEITFECLEECFRREEQLWTEPTGCEEVRQLLLRDIAKRRERHIEELMLNVNQWIQKHQKWMLFANLMKKCTVEIITIHVAFYFVAIIGSGYNITKTILDSQEIGYQYFFYCFMDVIFLLMTCNVGDSLGQMSNILSTSIYSTPWYYLPVNHRKVLLNFLCLVQNHPKIRLFNVFVLSLKLFPKMLNDAYGYIQVTRVLEMKHKR